ncbi:MAG: hypothetical protein A2V63_08150 [Candidatus Eisenbacteria bacterium RBG_19FT_COMBO_70_11]|nr:MAG: hypothetical protein A2V63_08150 [Candidatus Eisenbacteria bacterium RBG_19FT_COMBO_70_11]
MLVFAIALIAIDLGPHRIGGLDAETDFYGGYAPAAAALAQGRILTPQGTLPAVFGFVGPLYPAALALFGRWNGDYFHVAEGVSLVAALLVLALWGDLLRRRAGLVAGTIGVLLLAANPVLFRQGYGVTTDAMAVALQSLAVWLLLGRPERPAPIAAGAAAALAFLTRYTSVYLLPAGCLVIWLGGTGAPRRLNASLRFIAGFAALALPWVVFARLHGASVQFHQLLAFDVYGGPKGMPWDVFLAQVWPRFEHHPLAVFTADPAAVASRLFQNLVGHARLDALQLMGWPVAALAVAGLALLWARRPERALAPVVLCGAWAYLALVPAGHNERYALAVLPFYAALASTALVALLGLRPARVGQALCVVLALFAVSWSLLASIRLQQKVLVQQPLEVLDCATTLRTLAQPGDRVIARKPHLAWLAGLESTAYPASDDLVGLGASARESGARWLYVSVAEVLLRPQTAFLLDTTASVPGLTRRAVAVVPVRLSDALSWWRMGVLYEIGPELGQVPDWFANDTSRTLHLLRGSTATLPNAGQWLSRASVELMVGDTTAARAAWRVIARIDAPGAGRLLSRAGGDTLRAIARGRP